MAYLKKIFYNSKKKIIDATINCSQNSQDFIEKFASQFEETDAKVFTPDTKFRDLDEWCSFLALSEMAMIGDKLSSDSLAANRAGSIAVKVQPLSALNRNSEAAQFLFGSAK